MIGILLCGGEGTRLRPMTEVVNKHLIRVHNQPMAEYPLKKMIECGIKDIMIVVGGENFAAVVKYFGSGKKWNVNINYAIQDQPGGIAQALSLARKFVGDDNMMVCLGDNIWSDNLKAEVRNFNDGVIETCGLFIVQSNTPERFGVIRFSDNEEPLNIIEKPDYFISNWIVTGIYLYEPDVFDVIDTLKPSARGELEITDVNRYYLQSGLTRITKMGGWWSDCGTIETILQTERLLTND